MQQSDLFAPEKVDGQLSAAVSSLPSLPRRIAYFDEFEEAQRSVAHIEQSDIINVHYNGNEIAVDFRKFPAPIALLLKHSFVRLLSRGSSQGTAAAYVNYVSYLAPGDAEDLVLASPQTIVPLWSRLLARDYNRLVYVALKALLQVMCDYGISGWAPSYSEFASKSLAVPPSNKYAGLRSGKAFLTTDQEATIVALIDDSAKSVLKDPNAWQYCALADMAMVVCAFQFGLRPVQIARLKVRDVKHRTLSDGTTSAVHLSFPMVKQRSGANTPPLVRRVKPEWNVFFAELYARSMIEQRSFDARIFAVDSNREASQRIAAVLREALDNNDVGATHLRHSAAQRMVDAGANHEELAAFLGHSDISTSLVYFQTSETQAERINRALGLSPTYARVASIAENRLISAEELAALKSDQQIAGVPHGIPIAGIGGCSSGQPACPYNPVLSCYTCRRFMPLKDPKIHKEVLGGLRDTVNLFREASHAEAASPAYLQLQRTIDGVQDVLAKIEGGLDE
jgi:integrase